MRLNFQGQVGLFGRRANTYVKATYGSKSLVSPTVLYDPSAPLTHLFRFELTNRNSIKFQVFDKDFTDSTFVGDRGVSAGVMMAEQIVDIRPWIANGRFEGDITLHRDGGDKAGVHPIHFINAPFEHNLSMPSLNTPYNAPLLLTRSAHSINHPTNQPS